MYEAMDGFLNGPNWHTLHPSDQEQFCCVLRTIIDREGFNADSMGEYMRQRAEGTLDPQTLDTVIRHYRAAAWAVWRYRNARCP